MIHDPDVEALSAEEHFDSMLAAAQARAGWAFEYLFRRFAPRVSGYLRAQGSAEPDEVTNDVFVAVFRSLHRFEGNESAFRAWVFTIARRQLVDERRKRGRRPVEVVGDPAEHDERAGGDVEAEALSNLGDEWVRRSLAELSPDQRDVLLLRILGDMTIDQIARVVGKRPGAVKALQRRGLASVRRMVDQQRRTPAAAVRRLRE